MVFKIKDIPNYIADTKKFGPCNDHRQTFKPIKTYLLNLVIMERLDFVHLHLHSEYSLSDGIIRINELVSRASSLEYSAVGLTDLTNLFGLLEFYRSSRENGIKPIVGAEVNVIKDKDSFSAPIVQDGLYQFNKIVSKAYVDGQVNGQPMVELSMLQDYSEGLIALSGGMEGHIGQSILSRNNSNRIQNRIF